MSESVTTPPPEESKRDQFQAQAQQLIDNVKTEVAARLDQLLDELGAMI